MGEKNTIFFDITKTKLLYYSLLKAATEATLRLPNNSIITPKGVVKWLGIYFD
jgi:hypothetical protein